jgi:hypothetical protein
MDDDVFLTSTISVFLDDLLVQMGFYEYPLVLIPYLNISFVFDFLVYPLFVVWISYWTYRMKWLNTLLVIVILSLALALFEG